MKKMIAACSGAALLLASASYVYYRRAWYPVADKPQKGKTVVACIGDSITFGAGVKNRKSNSYPAHLQRELGDDFQVINYGMSGRTLISTGDTPYIREKNYQRSFTDEPDCYICMLGTNDSKPVNWNAPRFELELKAFLERYTARVGSERVIVMTPPKAFPQAEGKPVVYDIREENILEELPIIKKTAKELRIQVIDLHTFTENAPQWFADGVHPNAEGNRRIAGVIAETLQERGIGQKRSS